jgi:hypothetical protein
MERKKESTVNGTDDNNKNAIKDEMYWWLNARRSFKIGDEYEINLLMIDNKNKSVKILIRNLKSEAEKLTKSKFQHLVANEHDKSISELLSMFSEEKE